MAELNDHSSRAHALLSASGAHRWLNCPPSAVAAEAYPDEETPFTREGTLAHEIAEAVASGENPANIETKEDNFVETEITQEMVTCATAYRDYIQEHSGKGALVFLEQKVDYSPWVPGGFGTCDCIIIDDKTLTVVDYKYGKGVPVSAIGNPQMRLYALGALNDYGVALDVEQVEMHIFQPRINNISSDRISVDDLLTWADQLVHPVAVEAAKGEGRYKPGDWCTFCPHAGRCPSLAKQCAEIVETHDMRVEVPVLAPFEVANILKQEPLITMWLRRVKSQALTSLLDGVEIPGYKVVEGKAGNRKWTDELAVLEALEADGQDKADCVETKLKSPAAIDKLLGKKRAAEVVGALITRSPGSPTVVEETDKRPAFDPATETLKDFESI